MNFYTANLKELRDWLAYQDGWEYIKGEKYEGWWSHETKDPLHIGEHPFPETRDGAALALPEGWTWWRTDKRWGAYGPYGTFFYESTDDTGDEIEDRYRLAVLCVMAEKGIKNEE